MTGKRFNFSETFPSALVRTGIIHIW